MSRALPCLAYELLQRSHRTAPPQISTPHSSCRPPGLGAEAFLGDGEGHRCVACHDHVAPPRSGLAANNSRARTSPGLGVTQARDGWGGEIGRWGVTVGFEKWEMESGNRERGSGKWRLNDKLNGKYMGKQMEVRSGKWNVGYGKWEMVHGKW